MSPFYYGWVIVVIAGLANASRVASAVEVASMFVPAMDREFGWSRTIIASATTTGGIATALSGPFVGRVLDRYGARLVVPIGAFMVGIGCIALAGVQSAPLFIGVYALVRMSGQSFVQFPNQVTVAKWFERKRGRATAVLVGTGAMGLIAAPLAVQAIISRAGIGPAWIALGLLALTLGVVPSLLLMARRPEDLGLRPDGGVIEAPEDTHASAARSGEVDWALGQAARTRAFWMIAGSGVLFSLSSTGVGFHQLAYYVEQGVAESTAAGVVSTFAFGLTVGGMLWGVLADRVRIQILLVGQYAAAVVLLLFLQVIDTAAEAFPFSFSFGMLVGGSLSIPTLLLASYYGRGNLGSIAGIMQMTRGVSLGSGPLVAAIFYDVTGGYTWAFSSFAVFCSLAAVMIALAQRPRHPVLA